MYSALTLSVSSVYAQEKTDSLKQINLSEIVVSATRANSQSPVSYSNITEKDIKAVNTAKNIPFILQTLPSVVAFSEDGSGVGNTSFRIRGTDATRINVTLNGMPLNNPESQEVYWVNIPDISNSLQSIQIQRGIGSSTNGAAAFGASISMKTQGARPKAYGEASTAIGSYNTFTSSIAAGTGIQNSGLSFDARYSRVTGDGYIRNGKVNHKSFYGAITYYKENQMLKLSYINGIQHTGITWNGISPEKLKEDRKYNSAGKYYDDAENVHYYDNETDNYYSNIVQLTYSNELSNKILFNIGLSYNNGYGYYENYKPDTKFKKLGLDSQTINGNTYKASDIIRRKAMKNDFYVGNATINYKEKNLDWTSGFSVTSFSGDHYGKVRWVKYNQNIPNNYEWYRGDADKSEFSIFSKVNYNLFNNLFLYGDLQYRYIDYRMSGIDDDLVDIRNKNYYSFFNPKLGISYNIKENQNLYFSFALSNREPLRTDIKESVKGGSKERIKPEKMLDYELGYKYSSAIFSFDANLYYMNYKDQMIQTGKLNDVGYKLMENVPNSYRMGIELSASIKPTKWMHLDINTTLSKNKIKDYTVYYDLYDNQTDYNSIGQVSESLGSTDIAFSPNVISSGVLSFNPFKDFSISIIGKYVGKQYYDNTSNKKNQLADYFISNSVVGYSFKANQIGTIDLQLFVNNIFNKHYVANASGYTDKFSDGSEISYIGLFPQATRNIMVKLGIKF